MNASAPGAEPALRAVPALEVGGTHVTAALVDLHAGAVVAGSLRRTTLNPSGSAGQLLGTLTDCGGSLAAGPGDSWGVAIPGPFDYERGVGLFADVGKFDALYGVDVGQALAAGLPGPPGRIVFLNDADAFLWGEWLFGAAVGHNRCAAITLGTGIGSAFIADGELRHDGPGVPPEGRAHRLWISGLPLEEVVSARAIERSYQQRTGVVPDNTAFVADRARAGDKVAAEVLEDCFEQLGATLRPLLQDFGASVLVVGGSMSGSWDLIGPSLMKGLQDDGTSLEGLTAALAAHPEDAPLLGAAAYSEGAQAGVTR